MPTQVSNVFTSFEFTEDEQRQAALLNDQQKMFIQTLRAEAANAKLNLVPDPLNYVVYLQEEAEYRGRITAYDEILAASKEAEEFMADNISSE